MLKVGYSDELNAASSIAAALGPGLKRKLSNVQALLAGTTLATGQPFTVVFVEDGGVLQMSDNSVNFGDDATVGAFAAGSNNTQQIARFEQNLTDHGPIAAIQDLLTLIHSLNDAGDLSDAETDDATALALGALFRVAEAALERLDLGLCLAPLGLRVKRADRVGERIFVDGNSAAALGAVYGGATVCAWYPITPSTSVVEAFQKYCSKFRVDPSTGQNNVAVVQAEDELASIGMVVGAGWNGARAFTATSGAGVSLMTEFIGLAYFAEIPATIINVQRGGPSTGMPTRTQQADLISCAYASHGDTKHILLLPEDPRECFEHAATALDLADRFQTPVFVMTDLDIGMNQRLCEPFEWDENRSFDRGKVMTAEELEAGKDFGRYKDVDGDGIPWRTLPGTHPTKGSYFTRGTTRDAYARYSERGPDYIYNVERLLRKFATAATVVPAPIERRAPGKTRLGAIYFGSTSPAMNEALDAMEATGVHIDALRLRAFPFSAAVAEFIAAHDEVFIVEQNRDAQMRTLIVNELEINPAKLIRVLHFDGTPITARFITQTIAAHVAKHAAQPEKKVSAA